MIKGSIHPDTTLGAVYLTVSNLDRSLAFYQRILGFKVWRREGDTAYLGAGGSDLLVLTELPGGRRVASASGLYHFALLVPSRLELAQSLRRIAETRTPVQGIVDHWISEAIYLPDPDGNGIEIARDRPREQWPPLETLVRRGNGPLDVEGVLGELAQTKESWVGLAPETTIGHIHLHVASVPEAEAFYHGVLGFDKMMDYGPTAGFVSAGGYHHHIGFNTWAGIGAPPPPPDAVGLRWFVIQLPDENELNRVVNRVRAADLPLEDHAEGILIRDPSQNRMILTAVETKSND